jgi:hypothetical protein
LRNREVGLFEILKFNFGHTGLTTLHITASILVYLLTYLNRLWSLERKAGKTEKWASHRFECPCPLVGWMTFSASFARRSHSIWYLKQWDSHVNVILVLYGVPSHIISSSYLQPLQEQIVFHVHLCNDVFQVLPFF